MTLSTTQTKIEYIPDGVETRFAVPYPIYAKGDLRCAYTDTAGNEHQITRFDVEGFGSETGVYVRFYTPPQAGLTLVIYRETPHIQETDYPEGGKFPAVVVEQDFDRIVAMIQELMEILSRCLQVDISSGLDPADVLAQLLDIYSKLEEYLQLIRDAMDQIAGVACDSIVKMGTEPRKLCDKLKEIVSVKDYGAKGDGVTNDTSAFTLAASHGKRIFVPAGEYLVTVGAIDMSRLEGGEGVIIFTGGSSVALRNIANSDDIATVYVQELNPSSITGSTYSLNRAPQSMGICDDSLFIVQDVTPDGTNEVVRITEYEFRQQPEDNFDLDNLDGSLPVKAWAEFHGLLAHGTGCQGLILDGEVYLYSSASSDDGADEDSTGFAKIRWRGSNTTAEDVQRYINLYGVVRSEVGASQDGKYLCFCSIVRQDFSAYGNSLWASYGRSWQVSVFDRVALESAADPSAVLPLFEWKVDGPQDFSLPGNVSGICCDGRYIFLVFTHTAPSRPRSIRVYSLDGTYIKSFIFSGVPEMRPDAFLNGTAAGRVVTDIEVEGLCLYKDMLMTCSKFNLAKPVDIVSWQGGNFACKLAQDTSPLDELSWIKTTLPANRGEYSAEATYSNATGMIYHKYVTAFVPKGIYDPEWGLANIKRSLPFATNLATSREISFVGQQNAFFTAGEYWSNAEEMFPRFNFSNYGQFYLWDTRVFDAMPKEQAALEFVRIGHVQDIGLELFSRNSVADGAAIVLKHARATGDEQNTATIFANGQRVLHAVDTVIFYVDGRPDTDNERSWGLPYRRWSVIYAASGTINTSDARHKTAIAPIDEAVLRAWSKVAPKQFKFNDAVVLKGTEARIHTGYIAQDILEAFASEGLDATRYGLFCSDEWESFTEIREVINPDTGEREERTVRYEAGNIYGVRYDEALALEAAYQRWMFRQIYNVE